jgi:hypothetical protein
LSMSFWLILFASHRLGSYPLLGKLIHDWDVRRSQREAESMYLDKGFFLIMFRMNGRIESKGGIISK